MKRKLNKDVVKIEKMVTEQADAAVDDGGPNKKYITQSAVSNADPGAWPMTPIGHLKSVFTNKNGTPRQASVCELAKAHLTIGKHVFNNPEHSLEGLEKFSHVWLIFVFHKNNNQYTKAKVAPPRLDGAKVGLFSTRCPYRPNALGLSLVKLDKIEGSTLYLSGVDILDGTPILDIKPYIPAYDQPTNIIASNPMGIKQSGTSSQELNVYSSNESANISDSLNATQRYTNCEGLNDVRNVNGTCKTADALKSNNPDIQLKNTVTTKNAEVNTNENIVSITMKSADSSISNSTDALIYSDNVDPKENANENVVSKAMNSAPIIKDSNTGHCMASTDAGNNISDESRPSVDVANWIANPPIAQLVVNFTQQAIEQLQHIGTERTRTDTGSIKSAVDLENAIVSILQEDPRSPYRRNKCQDRLYYFTLEGVHVTCWFDDDFVQVLKVKDV